MRRIRRFAIVLVAIGLVTSAIYATGAFSNLTTSRETSVDVVGDKAGYLGLAPGENGEYTTYQNGELQLQLTSALEGEDAPSGSGVNHGAKTSIGGVVNITNQGTQSVGVWLQDTDDGIEFQRGNGDTLEGKGNAVTLTPGDTVRVGLAIDTTDTSAEDLSTQLTINADSDVTDDPVKAENTINRPTQQEGETATDNSTDSTKSRTESNSGENSATTKAVNGSTRELIKSLVSVVRGKQGLIQAFEDELNAAVGISSTPIDDILLWMIRHPEILGETLIGAAAGAVGMPNGEHPVDEAETVPYYAGWMISSFIPVVGIIPDIRDTVQGMANKNVVSSVLGLASIIPGLGKGGDVAQIGYYTSKWANKAAKASGVSKATRMVKSGVLSKLPDWAKTKIVDNLNNPKKAEDISDAKMQRYIDEGYNPAQVDDMVTNGKFTKNDIETFTNKGVDLDRVQTLRGKQVPVDDIRHYVDNDVSLHRVAELRNKEFSAKQVRSLSESGFDLKEASHLKKKDFTSGQITTIAEKGTDTDMVKQLRYQEFLTQDIIRYVEDGVNLKAASNLKRQGYSPAEVSHLVKQSKKSYVNNKGILTQAQKRANQGIPKDDIKYYVENGVSLKFVGYLRGSTKSSSSTKNIIKESMRTQEYGVGGANVIWNGHGWNKIQDDERFINAAINLHKSGESREYTKNNVSTGDESGYIEFHQPFAVSDAPLSIESGSRNDNRAT